MTATHPWYALLLAGLCSACSAPTPPADVATPPATPTPPATAPTVATRAPQITPAPASVADSAPDAAPPPPPVAAVPAPAPAPAPVEKPRPIAVGKAPRPPPPPATATPTQSAVPVHATVTTLSRGKGVPPETRETVKRIRALLEARQADAAVSDVQMQRIGLEGESRLCIEFRSAADAKAVLSEMRGLAAGADLLDIAESPCPYRKE